MKRILLLLGFAVCLDASVFGQAIHIVNTTNDNDDGVCNSAHCSLREAINASNINMGPDSIEFNIPGGGPHVIALSSRLPGIRDSFLVIDGTTEPMNNPMSGQIIIDGTALPAGPNHGFEIFTRKTEIYGLRIQNFPGNGIILFGGVHDAAFLSNIIIGAPGKGNVIVSNGGYGIEGPVDRDVMIQSNYVGTDLQFNTGLGNDWDGVFLNILSGTNVRVGGIRTANQGNYLCANAFSGLRILIEDPLLFAPGFSITGNTLGTDDTGTRNLGNQGLNFGGGLAGGGISIFGTGPVSIGGPAGLENIFAYNYAGFYSEVDDRRTIRENFFYCNVFKGIHLANNANQGILPPAILCLQGSTLVGDAEPGEMIDIYLHTGSVCPAAPCQGLTHLGRIAADGIGHWEFDVAAWPGGEFTAIAQDAQGNSSEFAACILDPNVIAYNSGPFCIGDTVFLFSELDTAVGNVVFEWFGPDGYTSTQQNPVDATMPGIYTVVADIMGCGADTAFTEVVFYPLATDTVLNFCQGDVFVINGTTYGENLLQGEELLIGVAQHGCDSLVVIDLQLNAEIQGRILSSRPRACVGDSIGYFFDLNGGNGPYDVVYTDGINPPDTLFNIHDGYSDTIIVTEDVHFEILDILTNETICEPILLLSDSIIVSSLSIAPLVTDFAGYGVSCFGENDGMIALNVTGGVGIVDYNWNIGSFTGDIASQLSAGFYAVSISDGAGCEVFFDTLITQPPLFEAILRTEATTCPDSDDGALIIDAIVGARGTLMYSLNGSDLASLPSLPFEFTDLPAGIHDLILTDSIGCTQDLTVIVPLGETPDIDLGTVRSILAGDSVLLDFSTMVVPDDILWTPADVVSCATCPVTYAFPPVDQYITLTLTDTSGCSISDSILILVFVPKQVFIPTVFSPNGDQVNDLFFIQAGESAVEVDYMVIEDRWGDVVFEKRGFPINDPAFGWDGTLDGKFMFPAVFTYLCRIRFTDDEILPFSGTVTLVR